jgi:hypothetical protein
MGDLTTNKIAMEEILFAHGMPLAKMDSSFVG